MTRQAIEREMIPYTLALQIRELLDKAQKDYESESQGLDGLVWEDVEARVQELVFGADE